MDSQAHTAQAQDRRGRLSTRERALAELAGRQHGVVSRRQLLTLGLGCGAIDKRVQSGRLHVLHRGVYAVGHRHIALRGRWLAAVLGCGEGALLSHRSAAALWGLVRARGPVEVTSAHGRPGRDHIHLHRAAVQPDERTARDRIPVTSVARTLLDLAEVGDERRLERAFEEADRLGLLQMRALERVCERGVGRRGLKPIRQLIATATAPVTTRSPLEDRFAAFCRYQRLPPPAFNTVLLDHEVDAFWPKHRLIVELDGFAYHRHRAAFERDRIRDAALQAAGYRVIRLTHRRLEQDPAAVASQLRDLLAVKANAG